MCHYITLIVPTADTAAVKAAMEKHGRTATPVNGFSLAKVLRGNERQYLTARGNCDCGTILAQLPDSSDNESSFVARLKRKKWSDGKIARAVSERRAAEDRSGRSSVDSYELWQVVLSSLKIELNLPYAGLAIHFYSGGIEDEAFSVTRREVPREVSVTDALTEFAEDEVTIFRF